MLDVLKVASVVGHGLIPEVVAEVAGIPQALATDALRAAADAGFVDPGQDGLVFRHALLREAVESTLLPSERRMLHRAVAARLEAGDQGSVAEAVAVARHWHLAGDLPRAHGAALRAAGRAVAAKDLLGALSQYELAIETWSEGTVDGADGTPLGELLLDAAETATAAGEPRRAVALAHQALELAGRAGSTVLRLRSLNALAPALHAAADDDDEAWRSSCEALQLVEEVDDPAIRSTTLAWAASVAIVVARFGEAHRLGVQAVAAARDAGALVDEARSLMSLGIATVARGDVEGGRDLLRRAEALARREGSRDSRSRLARTGCGVSTGRQCAWRPRSVRTTRRPGCSPPLASFPPWHH